jgi:muramoyltetrapeptide carboxypeptidase
MTGSIDRRGVIGLFGGAAAGLALPPAAGAAAAPVRKPSRLKAGDTVGLVAPSSLIPDRFDLALAEETITAMGLRPKAAPNLLKRHGYLAGEDKARAADINGMYGDDEVKAVFAVRGGWGAARLLPYLDFKTIRANPKMLVGFSDITALHMAFAAHAGFATIHGPTAGSSWGKLSWDSFREIAFKGQAPTFRNPEATEDRLVQRNWRTRTIRAGKASGRLLGGNLSVLSALIGTRYLPRFDGAILVLEDVDEAEYRVDRMLTQLALSGILSSVAGVVFGQCTNCRASGPAVSGFTLSEVLQHHLEPLGVPVFQGALFGHVENQFSLPMGIRAEIDADTGTIRMLEPAVS